MFRTFIQFGFIWWWEADINKGWSRSDGATCNYFFWQLGATEMTKRFFFQPRIISGSASPSSALDCAFALALCLESSGRHNLTADSERQTPLEFTCMGHALSCIFEDSSNNNSQTLPIHIFSIGYIFIDGFKHHFFFRSIYFFQLKLFAFYCIVKVVTFSFQNTLLYSVLNLIEFLCHVPNVGLNRFI